MFAAAVLWCLTTELHAQAPNPRGGSIRGTVVDDANRPVAQASLVVESTSLNVRTGPDGKFVLQNVPAGQAVLTARAVGYSAASAKIEIRSGQSIEVEIVLPRNVLDTNRVFGMSLFRSEWEERRAKKMGFVVDSARLTRPDFVSALTNMPLTRVRRDGFGATIGLRNLSGRSTCSPTAFLDGRLADLRVLTSRPPSEYRAIELLPAEQTPGKYQGRVGCGSMLFWSHKVPW